MEIAGPVFAEAGPAPFQSGTVIALSGKDCRVPSKRRRVARLAHTNARNG